MSQVVEGMRPGVGKLFIEARYAGLIIEGTIIRVSPRGVALKFWEDGTATRADYGIDLTVCKSIRTIKEMRGTLGLPDIFAEIIDNTDGKAATTNE